MGSETPKVVCINTLCTMQVHKESVELIKARTTIPEDFDTAVCSKRCYNAYMKELEKGEEDKTKQRRNRWHNDDTPASKGKSLMQVLLDWLMVEGNYNR